MESVVESKLKTKTKNCLLSWMEQNNDIYLKVVIFIYKLYLFISKCVVFSEALMADCIEWCEKTHQILQNPKNFWNEWQASKLEKKMKMVAHQGKKKKKMKADNWDKS